MYRRYEIKIQNWIDNSDKALLIYGARQVGKTYLIREMLKRNGIPYTEYNLIERSDVLKALENTSDSSELSKQLALYSDTPLTEGESVIFLDEIQKYPDIVTKIKFLVDENRYRYILSGSNLGVELKGIRSIPIGYVDEWQMMPMDLEEFALASGISMDMLEHVRTSYRNLTPVDEIVHEKMIRAFYYYLIVGGMPAVVNVYNEFYSLSKTEDEQKSIINQYKADFTKYEQENRKFRLISVYDSIPAQLNKQNRKFTYTLLDKEMKFERYEDSFLWLKDAAAAIPTYIVDVPAEPLEMSRETNVFKLFLSDVGLLTSCYPISVKKELMEMNPDRELNNGSLFENFVAQEIYASGISPYYFKKTKIGEVDFMIERDDGAVPVEVKSGSDYKKHTALNHLLKNYTFRNAYVLSLNNLEKGEKITYLPIYMAGLLCGDRGLDMQDHMPAL